MFLNIGRVIVSNETCSSTLEGLLFQMRHVPQHWKGPNETCSSTLEGCFK